MTHTADSNFVRIADGLDVEPLIKLLDNKPELWKEIKHRQHFTGTPHKNTESIYVRGGGGGGGATKNDTLLRHVRHRIV